MKERTCEKCGTIDYGIFGPLGLFGFSLMVASLGYSLAILLEIVELPVYMIFVGLIFYMPLCIIHNREKRKGALKNE